jgi:uncharacterized protein
MESWNDGRQYRIPLIFALMNAQLISRSLNLPKGDVARTLALLGEGATIPFLSRYRKEQTGGLDELQIAEIQKENQRLLDFEKRKKFIQDSISEQGKLSAELEAKINSASELNELEDLYLPFKQKRKTKASEAREKGLEALAAMVMKQDLTALEATAKRFVKGEVKSVDEALEGARFIMAEWMNERPAARNNLRRLFARKGEIKSKLIKGKEEEAQKYRDYFDFSEPIKRIPSHRLLAIRRAESEGILRVSIEPPAEEAIESLQRYFVKGKGAASEQVQLAVKDAYKRLMKPSIETEFKNETKEKADAEAIKIFAENLRQLLLTPRLDKSALWPSIRVLRAVAKRFVWTNTDNCSTTKTFTRIRRRMKDRRRQLRSVSWLNRIGLKQSPSETERRVVKQRTSCVVMCDSGPMWKYMW